MKRTGKMDDQSLLTRYVTKGDERSFRELVERYLGMVLGCAQRATGNRELAQEVAQNVFTVLAKKSSRLNPGVPLGPWLHRATVFEASRARRKESLRKQKMTEFAKEMDTEPFEDSERWNEVVPIVDAAVDRLSRDDRQVVVLRFFEGRTYRDIGNRVGKSEDATRKQVDRALGKLSRVLGKTGVVISATALAAELGRRILEVVPGSELVGVISATAVSSATAPAAAVTTVGIQKVLTATALLATLPAVVLWGVNRSYAQEVNRLEGQTQRLRYAKEQTAVATDAIPPGSRNPSETAEAVELRTLRKAFRQLEKRPYETRALFRTLALVYKLRKDQLPAALEMFQASQIAEGEIHIPEALFSRWAQFDPREAIRHAKELRWHGGRVMALEGILKEWVVHDPEAALAASEVEMSIRQQDWMRVPVLATLVAHDPHKAAAQLESASGAIRSGLLSALAYGWTNQDPEAALSWAAGLEGRDREEVIPSVMWHLAERNPERALEAVLAMENLQEQDIRGLFGGWVRKDLRGAMNALTEKIPEELRTEQVIEPFCWECSSCSTKEVLALAAQLPDTNVVNKFLSRVAVNKKKDIPGALQLLSRVPESSWREQAVSGVTNNWFKRDPEAVELWLQTLPPSRSRDSGIYTYSQELEKKDPRRAGEWALTISNPESRSKRLRKAFVVWMREDKRAALKWLEGVPGLSRGEREELRNVR